MTKRLIFSLLITCAQLGLTAQDECPLTPLSGTAAGEYCAEPCPLTPCTDTAVRSIDGTCNNLSHPERGMAAGFFTRLSPSTYGENNGMIDNTNPRLISNAVSNQKADIPDPRGLSSYMYSWLQFLDHDLTLTAESEEFENIGVPTGDPLFDPFGTGTEVLPFRRSKPFEVNGVREHKNELTPWIDGSMVYGSDAERAEWLRTFSGGKLKTSNSVHGPLLPFNTFNGQFDDAIDPAAPPTGGDRTRDGNLAKTYVAGDIRVAEQPTLTALHTVFMREHNRICDEMLAAGHTNDEEIYQFARAKVIGIIQAITYRECLPALGLPGFGSAAYNSDLDPALSHEFSTAAFRLGHSMLPGFIPIADADCQPDTYQFRGKTVTGEIELRDAFFNLEVVWNNGLEGILRGLQTQTQQKIDNFVIDDLRNFLFGAPGAGGLDLVTLNIQRGRDHGLADYNTIRESVGLPRYTGFAQITADPEVQASLAEVYDNDINRVDAWVGMISEDHLPGASVGPTVSRILHGHFKKLRKGDRLWFQRNPLLNGHKNEIKNTTLAQIIMRNTEVRNLDNVFFSAPCRTLPPLPEEYCAGGGEDSSYEYIKKVIFINDGERQIHQSGNDDGYADYTDEIFDMKGQSKAIFRIVPKGVYDDCRHYKIWVDYNRDGDFDDADEWVYARYYRRGTAGGRFFFPSDLLAGTYRMRIGMNYGNPYFTACEAYQYGETEDYLIDIDPYGASERSDAYLASDEELQPPSGFVGDVHVFPNPASEYVQFTLHSRTSDTAADLQLINVSGKTVQFAQTELRAGENLVRLDLRKGLLPGIYFLRVERPGMRLTSKAIVVEKG